MSETWLEWHIVLSCTPDGAVQRDFILDFIGPKIEQLNAAISLFHFLRYVRLFSAVRETWAKHAPLHEVEAFLGPTNYVNYITFRVRTSAATTSNVRNSVEATLRDYRPRVVSVQGEDVPSDKKVGLAPYGGDEVHPVQHEFFDCISRVTIQLLGKARAGTLVQSDQPCGTEDVALQWSHILYNQLGVVEQILPEHAQIEQAVCSDGSRIKATRNSIGKLVPLFYLETFATSK